MRISRRMRERRRERRADTRRAIVVTFVLIFVCFGLYVGTYYRPDANAINEYMPLSLTEEKTLSDGSMAYVPEEVTAGVIFYPGGKVDEKAYIPLMKALASRGILSVLVKMPYNLAVLKIGAADGIREQFPEVDHWYMAGHSLGGSMAATYAYNNADDFDGVILLAAYSTKNLSEKALKVASVYGSLDGVMNREKYEQNKKNLPVGFFETVLDGANHAGFGMYGAQSGDNEATMTNAEQIDLTADIIAEFVK